jgi:recombination protein RecR
VQYPDHLLKLIAVFKKLPGVGSKSAERFAFHLLGWPEEKLLELSQTIGLTHKNLIYCPECGFLNEVAQVCSACQDPGRDHTTICVVASAKDVFLIEQTHSYGGLYHVLGGLLSPLQGLKPAPHSITKLKERILKLGSEELILALDSTLEGDATALFLKKELETLSLKTSRLALGLPMGSPLDYIDGGTLARALAGRHSY